jgi:hypothetical protein
VAKPPEATYLCQAIYTARHYSTILTKPLFRSTVSFNDFNNTRTQGLNRGDVVGEDTHVTSGRSNVHLRHLCRVVQSLLLQTILVSASLLKPEFN